MTEVEITKTPDTKYDQEQTVAPVADKVEE
jgi:hypothetical protein